jgi:radical SAM superfamily enzyme YgiQ (UPF0313 family)
VNARSSPRVLLIHPARPHERTYPLGLAYLASAAQANDASVVGLDLRLSPPRRLRSTLRRHRFDYVGVTALSTTVDEAAAVVDVIRRIQPTAFVVVGGPHATLAPRDTLVRTRADAAVLGDGEGPFTTLLTGGLDGPGLMLRGAETPSPVHIQQDLDQLHPPDRRVFPLGDYYRDGIHGGERRTSVVATRGCRLECGFCSAKACSRGFFRTRSIDAVVDEVRRLRHDHGIAAIAFEDDNLVLDAGWCQRLFEALAVAVPGMRYDLPNGVHPALIDEAMIDVMQRAGVRSLAFGVESGSAVDRDALGRSFDMGHLARVCLHARNAGIITTGYVLVGLPEQSMRDALSQTAVLRSLPFDMLHVSVLLDLPGQASPGIANERELRRWKQVRRAMYAAIYADPRRAVRVVKLAGGDARALMRLASRWL